MDQQVSRGGDWIDDDEIVLDANESFDDDFDDVGEVDDVGRAETEVSNEDRETLTPAAKSAAAEAPVDLEAVPKDVEITHPKPEDVVPDTKIKFWSVM